MVKNTAGQKIGAQMVSAADGSAFTGAVTVAVTIDAGTQATGSVGSGACTHEGNGYHTYAPAQAETNGTLIAFTFTGTGAVPATVQVFATGYDPTAAQVPANVTQIEGADPTDTIRDAVVDDATRIDASALNTASGTTIPAILDDTDLIDDATSGLAKIATDVAAILVDTGTTLQGELDGIQADTEDIQSRLPAALTADGNIKADTLRIGGTLQTANDVGADVDAILADTADMQPKLGTPAGASISADIAAIEAQTDDIGTAGAGLTAVPWNAAWDAEVQSEVQDAIEANHLDHLLATTYDPASKPGAADALLNELVESDAGVARYTANALEQGPSGGGGVADWTADERTALRSILGIPASGTTPDDPTTGILDTIRDSVATRASQTSVDDLPTNAELATALGTADDAVLAAIAALNDLSAADIRSAVGLASANLDTQLGDLPTNSELSTALAAADDAVLAAIAALNNLSQANIRTAVGLGSANLDTQLGDLPTNAELATALAAADDAVLAAIAALNNLSAAQVNAEVVDALTVDTYAEPAAVPAATASLKDKLGILTALARNKSTLSTLGAFALRNDADSGNIGTRTDSDDNVTYTKGELG